MRVKTIITMSLMSIIASLGFNKKSTAQTMTVKEIHTKSRAEIIEAAQKLLDEAALNYPLFNPNLTRILVNKNDAFVLFRINDLIYVPQNSTIISGASVNLITGVINSNTISSIETKKELENTATNKTIEVKPTDRKTAIEAVAKSRNQSPEELEKHIESLFPNISLVILNKGSYYSVSEYMDDSYEWYYLLNKKSGVKYDEFSASIEPNPITNEEDSYKEIKKLESTLEEKKDLIMEPSNVMTIDEYILLEKNKANKRKLIKFRNKYGSKADITIKAVTVKEYELLVSHKSNDGYFWAESYTLNKETGKAEMIWHEQPIKPDPLLLEEVKPDSIIAPKK